jgi:hypothetical protein
LVSGRCGILDMDDLYILSDGRLVMLDRHIYLIQLFLKLFCLQMIISVSFSAIQSDDWILVCCKPAESNSDIDALHIPQLWPHSD